MSRSRVRLAAMGCLVSAALGLGAGVARAFPYVVQKGDAPTSLAQRFYGRVEREKLLVVANHLEQDGDVAPGTRLEVPAASHHRVLAGETWESLAERFLGQPWRGEALAMSNESYPWIPVETGREIVIPYVLRVVVGPTDSTSSLAYTYLGRRDDAFTVDRFNALKGRTPKSGDVLLLPLSRLDLTDEGQTWADESRALSIAENGPENHDAQEQADRELAQLEREAAEGLWLATISRGNRLRGAGKLSDPQVARSERALLEAYAALGELDLAREACDEWRRTAPELVLDPVRLSPKIMRACAGVAGGARFGTVQDDAEPSEPVRSPTLPRSHSPGDTP